MKATVEENIHSSVRFGQEPHTFLSKHFKYCFKDTWLLGDVLKRLSDTEKVRTFDLLSWLLLSSSFVG